MPRARGAGGGGRYQKQCLPGCGPGGHRARALGTGPRQASGHERPRDSVNGGSVRTTWISSRCTCPPSRATLEENHTVETLQELRDEGKVRFIGMSGILPDLPDHLAMNVFDAFQIPYSAVQRDHENLIAEAAEAGAGTLIRGGAARGAASEEKNWRTGPLTQEPGLGQRNWETSGIEDLLADAGMSTMEFVLRFTLSHPGLSTTIVGTANPAHLATNITTAEKGPLPADLYEEAKKRLPQ